MKTKKIIVPIKSLFTDLIYKNVITLLVIILISICASFYYNTYYKNIKYSYSINILASSVWTSNEAILEDTFGPKNYLRKVIKDYLSGLPSNVREKKFNNKTSISISFISLGVAQIKVDNFLDFVNSNSRNSILTKFRTDYSAIKRMNETFNNINLNKIAEDLENYPEILKIQKIEQAINTQQNTVTKENETTLKANELKYYMSNFDELFKDDMYYSLNGWTIQDNKLSNFDKVFSGILFGFLIGSLFMFFKSNYLRNIIRS